MSMDRLKKKPDTLHAIAERADRMVRRAFDNGLRSAAAVCRERAEQHHPKDGAEYEVRYYEAEACADAIERLMTDAGAGERVPRERVAAPAPALHRPLCNVNFVHPEIAAQRRTSTHGDGATVRPSEPLTARQAAEVRVPSQFERAQDDEHEERRAPPPTCPRCGQTVSGEHECYDIVEAVADPHCYDITGIRSPSITRLMARYLVDAVVARVETSFQRGWEARVGIGCDAAVEAARREERQLVIDLVRKMYGNDGAKAITHRLQGA